ncbi:MAG TPA: DUF58 domain-containing protein [Candidatus Bathyarchaeia archaeon]
MLSQRVPLLIAFSASIILASIALKDWRPLTLILPLASLLFLTRLISPITELNVEVKRELTPDSVMVGETTTVKLKITNKSKERIDFLEIYDRLPEELTITKGTNHLVLSINPEEKTVLTYEVSCVQRGRYEIGPVYLRSQDPLGFNFSENTQSKVSSLRVVPSIEKLSSSDLPFKRTGHWPGIIHSSRRGDGTEFYGLRSYIPGDDLGRVEWKASARTGKLMTIEHESERSANIVIILDAGKDSKLGKPPETLLEYSIKAAGSLASLLLGLGNQVSLISHCEDRGWLPGGFGKRHLRNILNYLTSVKAGEAQVPLGFELPYIFSSRPQVVLISPLLNLSIVEDVKSLEGYNIFVISPSLSNVIDQEASETEKLTFRVLALERRNIISELRRYCIVLDWDTQVPLRTAMKGVRRWYMQTRRH